MPCGIRKELREMKIIETDWNWRGALSERARTDYIALHHAEASTCTARQVDEWHKSNGWIGIGYHFFVRKDGSIYRGRPLDKLGAHVQGMNNRSVGICAEGAYSRETMPFAQKKAIAELIDYLKTNYYPNARIVGHKEIGSSDCPGSNYPLEELKNYKAILNKESDDLTMTQYEELKNRIAAVESENSKLKDAMGGTYIYNYIDDNMPDWARDDVKWCADNGIIEGTGEGFALNHTKLWVLVVLHRAIKLVCKLMNVKI